jgi:hypothetical protein
LQNVFRFPETGLKFLQNLPITTLQAKNKAVNHIATRKPRAIFALKGPNRLLPHRLISILSDAARSGNFGLIPFLLC